MFFYGAIDVNKFEVWGGGDIPHLYVSFSYQYSRILEVLPSFKP